MTAITNVPDFRVTLDGVDLTDKLRPRLLSLRLTEKRGGEVDQLDIDLTDHDGRLAIPRAGATLSVELGWSAGSDVTVGLVDKGSFIVDEVSHSGPPDIVTLRARGADFTTEIRTRREHSWHDTTIGAIVRTIAGRNALTARCAPALASIAVKSMAQSRESDIALLRRLGREHDAIASVKAGALVFAPIGAGTTATGRPIPALTLRRRDGDRHTYSVEKREESGSVTADWHDRKSAKKHSTKVGAGKGPTRRLARVYPTEAAAKTAAKAERSRSARRPVKLDLALALGRLDIYPDRGVTVSGFKSEIDAVSWIVGEVSHTLTDRGFTSAVKLETRG